MEQIENFIKNNEPLKIRILEYEDSQLDIIHISNEYYLIHKDELTRKKEAEKEEKIIISSEEFEERLYKFIRNKKISELLITLYLLDLKEEHPSIYQLNRYLQRTSEQRPATLKNITKLEKLHIVEIKQAPGSPSNAKNIFINKKFIRIYGEDDFKQMLLDEWNDYAKTYIEKRLNGLREGKEMIKEKIRMIKKKKRVKKDKEREKD